jgi:hypothetical protein
MPPSLLVRYVCLLVSIAAIMIFTSHLMACAWGMTATMDGPGLSQEFAILHVFLTSSFLVENEDWMELDIYSDNTGQGQSTIEKTDGQYVAALYFAVCTISGVRRIGLIFYGT